MDTMVRLILANPDHRAAVSNKIPINKLLTVEHSGPFRKTCELTLGLLRQNEDALMTVLETFLHDPTTDFIGKKVCTPLKPLSNHSQTTQLH